VSANIKISHPTKIAKGTINLTGSKSISNRALIIQALCKDDFEIENLSNSADTQTLAYCAATGREAILSGSDRMHSRPIGELAEALKSLGADIDYLGENGYPPLEIRPSTITKNTVTLKSDISSQFITALLLIAPTLPSGLAIKLTSEPVSRPYIEMTLRMMEYFGVAHTWNGLTIQIDKQDYIAKDYFVESDWSSASYLYAIAAIADEADITINGLTQQQLQGDSAISEMMTSFGVESTFADRSVHITK